MAARTRSRWTSASANTLPKDPLTLLKIARLRTQAARSGLAVDVLRLGTDRAYAAQWLRQVIATNDANLQAHAMAVWQALDLPAPQAPGEPPGPVAVDVRRPLSGNLQAARASLAAYLRRRV